MTLVLQEFSRPKVIYMDTSSNLDSSLNVLPDHGLEKKLGFYDANHTKYKSFFMIFSLSGIWMRTTSGTALVRWVKSFLV